ncbi:MAG TPA: hypothetical protein VEA80_15375 [Vitreimonas sp.]|uniref:hypothetical protein n=1 Tax=Vitreimonas sp. TaxID=3069702 RepID=UPI002D540BC1|nr:hypothetical protein [Vitreimonas sp.]HYD88854.1 hypothetical protein [Vitreimonas sp.]
MVLIEQPQVGGLMGTHLELQRVDLAGNQPIGASQTVFLLIENHLVRTDAAGGVIGTSEFAKARMEPGDYAVLQITDTMSQWNYIQMLCYDRAAPVVRIPPNSVVVVEAMQVLQLRAMLGESYDQIGSRRDSLAAAREVLRGYPNIEGDPVLAEVVDVVAFEDSGSLNIIRDQCDSHTPFRSVQEELRALGESHTPSQVKIPASDGQ